MPITRVLSVGIGTLALAQQCWAAVLVYDLTYDPIADATTLANGPSSEASLEFHVRNGPLASSSLWLAAGESVSVDKDGVITGPYLLNGIGCNNKKKAGVKIFTNLSNEPIIWVLPDGTEIVIPANGSYTTSLGGYAKFPHGRIKITDCDLTTLTDDTSVVVDSPNWPGPSSQASIELLSGSIHSIDDSSAFLSVFTPQLYTGCPEPVHFATICGITAMAGCLVQRYRKRKLTEPRAW